MCHGWMSCWHPNIGRRTHHERQYNLRIVQAFEFEGYPGQLSLETVTFDDLGGRCRIMQHSMFPTVESRDMFISDGLESGMRDSMDRLDELVSYPLRVRKAATTMRSPSTSTRAPAWSSPRRRPLGA
jgi:hypothetical protein